MRCQKQEKRTFLTLWKIFKCNCNRKEDQKIDMSGSFIYFLYLEFLCDYLFIEEEKAIYYYSSKIARDILRKLIEVKAEIVVCWVDKEELLEECMGLFEELLDNKIPIFVLCEN